MASGSKPSSPHIIEAHKSSASSFSPFGHIIDIDIPQDIQFIDSAESNSTSDPQISNRYIKANKNTALKSKRPWDLMNNYASAPSKSSSGPVINTFSCFPQQILAYSSDHSVFTADTLERHPYTTQSFIPMTHPDADPHAKYLVIVSPNDQEDKLLEDRLPDVSQAKAFILNRGQAVTYGAGTWHSPMVVLGPSRIDFVVIQHVNDVEDENCETRVVGGEGLKVMISDELLEPRAR